MQADPNHVNSQSQMRGLMSHNEKADYQCQSLPSFRAHLQLGPSAVFLRFTVLWPS